MTWAISFQNSDIHAARYDPNSGESELVRFQGQSALSTRFNTAEPGKILPIPLGAAEEDDAGVALKIEDDGMTLESTGSRDGITTEDLLVAVCKTVLATDEAAAATDHAVVFVAAENPLLRSAAQQAGFADNDISFLLPVDAAIQEWRQYARANDADDSEATDVVVLTCRQDGVVEWEARVANDHGFFVVPDHARAHTGYFAPPFTMAAEASLQRGLKHFFAWTQQQNASQNVILTGSAAQTDTVTEFAAAVLNIYGYNVFFGAETVRGACQPQMPSRYQRCDDALHNAWKAAEASHFDEAIEAFKAAEALFETPPTDVERVRRCIRERLLAAAKSEASEQRYQQALSLSPTDTEKADVYLHLVDFYAGSENIVAAQESALSASFFDATLEAAGLAKLAPVQRG